MRKLYALYKGDKFITEGTIEEIANFKNVKKSTIDFLKRPVYKKRCKGSNHLELVEMYDVMDQYDDIIRR